MKKINFILFILVSSLSQCAEEKIDNAKDKALPTSINETWRLTSVVNLSDESKYLNAILELHDNNTYKLSNNTGVAIISGSFEHDASSITFNNGLFDNYKVRMQLIKLNGTEFWIKEHYTFDNKNTSIEYHWTKK